MQIKNISVINRLFEINATLPEHGMVAIIGPNGAGKSTLLKLLAGIIRANQGKVLLHSGEDLLHLSSKQRAQQVSYLAQNTPVYWDIDVESLISLGFLNKPLIQTDQRAKQIETCCEALHLMPLLTRSILSLSGGEQARVHLARATVAGQPILLADEPIASLDPFYQLEMMDYLQQLATQKLVVVVLHDLLLASRYADYFILLKDGKVMGQGERAEIMQNSYLNPLYDVSVTLNSLQHVVAITR